ncbi:MAG: choice-of-anchor Q domain-containing protein [Candidatus Thiodiazotropha sp.]
MSKYQWSYFFSLVFSFPALSAAATLQVDKNDLSCNDTTGTPFCSISAGIDAAADGDTITISAGTYSENPTILKSLTISGAGSDLTIVDGGARDRVFFTQGTIAISNLTVRNGDAGDSGLGGGIWANMGSLTLTDSVVSNNTASDGGGIGTAGQLTLVRTVVSDNTATNSFGTSSGGGLYIGGSATQTTISDSTISNNTSDYQAGGIFNIGQATTVTNSTISGNLTLGSGGGGALVNGSGSSANIVLSSVTITDNTADTYSGGILNNYGQIRLHNSLVAGNRDSGYAPDCAGQTITSDGYNFIGTTAGCALSQGTGDQLNQGVSTARLAPLASNGGTTPTHAIQMGSTVIDAGDPSGCTDANSNLLTTDQTGGTRTVDGNADTISICDIGAFELKHGVLIDSGNVPLTTTEGMGMASFDVVLISQPSSDVTISLASSDTTEGTVSPNVLTFTAANWSVRQQVVITGADDSDTDGDVGYEIAIGPTSSLDPDYDYLDLAAVSVTNMDDEGSSTSTQDEGGSGGGGAIDLALLLALIADIGRRAAVRKRLN